MIKILQYSFSDLTRSRWNYFYFAFYFLTGIVLLFLNDDLSKAVITFINIIIVLTPLIGTLFGIMYFYHSREFTELLLAQPIRRSTIFLGQFFGLSLSLSASFALGLGIPFILYGILFSTEIFNFLMLIVTGVFLTFIFVSLSFNIALDNENRIRGFAFAVLLWLFLAVIYDGLFLLFLVAFNEYPLDKFALLASTFNPIDLSRILILLKLDISALLGYTGAVFQNFFGTGLGLFISLIVLLLWSVLPVLRMLHKLKSKDF
ncbi:MAG: ABC transporter permease [Spirochaetia bacterium]|nr:ABC transporter permease [Spirochaetia bacterium]